MNGNVDWKVYHSALSRCAELLDNMKDGDPITDTPKFLAEKLASVPQLARELALLQAAKDFAQAHIDSDEIERKGDDNPDTVTDAEMRASHAVYNSTKARLLEVYRALQSGVSVPQLDVSNGESALLIALRKIVDNVPAVDSSGQFFTEHHGMDGEYLGAEYHDPAAIIQSMQGVAMFAIETHAAANE